MLESPECQEFFDNGKQYDEDGSRAFAAKSFAQSNRPIRDVAWGWDNGYRIKWDWHRTYSWWGLVKYAGIRCKSRIDEGLTLASCVIPTAIGTLLEISSRRLLP